MVAMPVSHGFDALGLGALERQWCRWLHRARRYGIKRYCARSGAQHRLRHRSLHSLLSYGSRYGRGVNSPIMRPFRPPAHEAVSACPTSWLEPEAALREKRGALRVESIPLPERSHGDLCHCQGVHQQSRNAPHRAVRLVKDAELAQQRRAVVVDPLAGQAISIVEREDAAERQLDLRSRSGQPAPRAQMLSADDHLEDDGARARMRAFNVNAQSWHRLQQLLIKSAHLIASDIMRVPRLVIAMCARSKGAHDGVEVMGVFMPHVLFDELEARRK